MRPTWLERNPLETAMPRWNRTGAAQEVPDLDSVGRGLGGRRRSSCTSSTSRGPGVRQHGPYLGGSRVRLAAAGDPRILPLGYTGTGMTRSKSTWVERSACRARIAAEF